MKKHFSIILFGALALTAAVSCESDTPEPEPIKEYAIAVTAGRGGRCQATADGKAASKARAGERITLTATPDEGFAFEGWTVEEGGVELAGNPATFTMPEADVSVRADFTEEVVTVTDVYTRITDPVFLYYCQEIGKFDTDGDGTLSLEEAAAVREINVNEMYKLLGERVRSMDGIEYFTSLTLLTCYGNSITELDLAKNTELTYLHVGTNRISKLDVTGNTKLQELYVSRNEITEIDLSKCPDLRKFQCVGCNNLTSLDLSHNPLLTEIYAENCPKIATLDCSHNPELTIVRCFEGNLTTLDLTGCTKIEALNCFKNQLTALDVSKCTALTVLDCSNNRLTSIDVSQATALDYLMCFSNRMTELDASAMSEPDHYYLSCGLQTTDGTTPQTLTLTLRDDQKPRWQYEMLQFDNNAGVELAGGEADIFQLMTDPKFKAYCEQFDTDKDGRLTEEEASAVTEIVVPNLGLTSLDGIMYFASLTKLVCNDNELTKLNVPNPELVELVCNDNKLTELNVNDGIADGKKLVTLSCQNNRLTELSVVFCHALKTLNCQNNQLTDLRVNRASSLSSINCSNNKLTGLDFYQSNAVVSLNCSNNELTSLGLSNKKALMSVMCNNNPMTSLDISGCTSLVGVMAFECRLSALDASEMANPEAYSLFCGNQTSDGSAPLTLTLTLRDEQKAYWDSTMKDSSLNANVVLAE